MSDSQKRLRWACRRGMLELDLLLEKFLDSAYQALPIQDQELFAELLQCNDQELFNWLMGKEIASNPRFAYMVEKIRSHAQA